VFSFTKTLKLKFEAITDDSRAQAKRSHQALKESSSENQVWIKSTQRRRSSKRLVSRIL